MPSISASVGAGGRNRPRDVRVVQRLLNESSERIGLDRMLAEDGLVGRKTVLAIVEFQGRVVGLTEPDGRVDPGGSTLRILNQRGQRFARLEKNGPGFYAYGVATKRHGTRATLASVRRLGRALEDLGLEIGVGNISFERGGRMRPHTSHQRGVDVDLRPLRQDSRRKGVTISDAEYSRTETRKLVRALRRDANLDLILFNDTSIVGVTSWAGHDNHLHVRFAR